jgi:probable F420-dependent oxidoreductase
MASYPYMHDYLDIIRRLWNGEQVTYEGPVGKFEGMSFAETYHGPDPELWFAGFALPKGARLVAEHCDGVLLPPMLTPAAVGDAVERIRTECERIDRDPDSVRVAALVVTAPDMDDFESRAIAHGRAVTYLQYKGYGETLCEVNGWDKQMLDDIRNHEQFTGLTQVADRVFQRHQMMEVAAQVRDPYMEDCCSFGTVDECVTSLKRFIDAGADEIATYGSTPGQNAGLVAAWRDR